MKNTVSVSASPQFENYKIVPNSAKWKEHDNARLQISVPASPCFDAKFEALADWTMERFKTVTLCLHDTIQRYNLMAAGMDEKTAFEIALKNGEIWLQENSLISSFMEVIRWEKLRTHPSFADIHERVVALYAAHTGFKEAVDEDIAVFASRCKKRGESFDACRVALSRTLLLEEIAGYVVLWRETSATDIHPGMRLKASPLLLDGLGDFLLKPNTLAIVRIFERPPSLSAIQ